MLKIVLAAALSAFCSCDLSAKVLLGIDVLEKQEFAPLKGKKTGLVTNHTGVNAKGRSTIDVLHNAKGVSLIRLFSPEHGIRGKAKHGEIVSDDRDGQTGLPIYSLYGKAKRPTEEMLSGLDVLVFDIQDIGTRFYTYITTLAYLLEEAAKKNIEVIVLDRPNPLTGSVVEGEVLSPEINHFTAYLRVPTRHGLTAGEIAEWHNRTARVHAKLTVIKMEGWQRGFWWGDTGLKFRPTSPNIRSVTAAMLYPGIGAFESTNVSVGRGTRTPFEVFGAPWIEEKVLLERLNFLYIPGFAFRAVRFTPKNDLYKGELCKGIKVIVKDKNTARPVDLFVHAAVILKDLYPDEFKPRREELARVTGSETLWRALETAQSAESALAVIRESAARFETERKPYLLYKPPKDK